MKCFIKSMSTFQTLAQREIDDYSLALDSMTGEKSNVTILSEDSPAFLTGNWLIFNGGIWIIDSASPSKGKTRLGLLPPDGIFDRVLLYSGGSANTVGDYIANVILYHWRNQSDIAYRTPYVSAINSDTTEFVVPETEDNQTFNFLEFIRKMRSKYGVTVYASFSGNMLIFNVKKDAEVIHPLVQNDGHTKLISSDFKASSLAKITVFKQVDTGQKDENDQPIYQTQTSVWYLAEDGSVSNTAPQNRASGGWGSINIGNDDDPLEKATEEFGKNESSRKIEIYSDVDMKVGDKARIRINGEIVESTVMAKYSKSGETRIRYKLGDMITTLSEKLERSAKK